MTDTNGMRATHGTKRRAETPKSLERARLLVTPVLAAASAGLAPELRRVAEFHWGWVDETGAPIEARPGKALRPTLALLSAEAVGADVHAGLAGAAAVEIVHDFTLLHDDVMDEDRERRGRPAAWTRFGVGGAICGGDAMMLLALQLLLEDRSPARTEAVSQLVAATQTVIAGQALDLAFEGRVDIGVDDYLDMAEKKTGALLGCAASIGAILAGGTAARVDGLRAFGLSVGLAFQAVDDWLGIWGDPARVGKPRASDLRQRKCSLPILLALASDAPAGRAMRDFMQSDAPVDEAAIERGIDCLDALGAEQATRDLAHQELARALAWLEDTALVPDTAAELAELACFVVEREL